MDGYEKERRHSFFVKAGSFYGLCLRRGVKRGYEEKRRRGDEEMRRKALLHGTELVCAGGMTKRINDLLLPICPDRLLTHDIHVSVVKRDGQTGPNGLATQEPLVVQGHGCAHTKGDHFAAF